MQTPIQRDYWPSTDWQEAAPQDMGMNPEVLTRMQEYIGERIPGLHGLLIVRHGYLVFEEYYQEFHRKSYNSISSATKSVVSMLVGVALQEGLLKSIDQHMLDFFPEYAEKEQDPRKHAVTLRHLLSLQNGFSREMPVEYWRNPVHLALGRPMMQQPGEEFFYDSQGVDILSGILTVAAGKNAAAFADATLFERLGIWRDATARFTWRNDPQGAHTWHEFAFWDEQDGYLWKVDPQGNNPGGFGAHFTAREMAKLGYLYLNRGYWNGEQVVPDEYVSDSTRRQSEGGPPVNEQYGYLFWIPRHEHQSHGAYFASGFGGKVIYVVPGMDLVVVTIASTEKALKDSGQWEEIKRLVPHFVIPAMIRDNT